MAVFFKLSCSKVRAFFYLPRQGRPSLVDAYLHAMFHILSVICLLTHKALRLIIIPDQRTWLC